LCHKPKSESTLHVDLVTSKWCYMYYYSDDRPRPYASSRNTLGIPSIGTRSSPLAPVVAQRGSGGPGAGGGDGGPGGGGGGGDGGPPPFSKHFGLALESQQQLCETHTALLLNCCELPTTPTCDISTLIQSQKSVNPDVFDRHILMFRRWYSLFGVQLRCSQVSVTVGGLVTDLGVLRCRMTWPVCRSSWRRAAVPRAHPGTLRTPPDRCARPIHTAATGRARMPDLLQQLIGFASSGEPSGRHRRARWRQGPSGPRRWSAPSRAASTAERWWQRPRRSPHTAGTPGTCLPSACVGRRLW
jgi:hypothetical protein